MMNEHVVNLAASALTSWKTSNGKHGREQHDGHDAEANNPTKRPRTCIEPNMMMGANHQLHVPQFLAPSISTIAGNGKPELKPFPFFYYRDHSMEEDPDPLTPLTFPGRVPNFPAKLHAILSRPDLADIIDWLPHGRSWRVLKPREFETKIIPKFFEHSKFSSFVRQANGWGFRRITQGPDRNSYYHEKFLRGLPHLCKTMKRPGVAEKKVVDPDLEPDFYKISEIHPVPEAADEESIFLQKTLQSGPKSRMPILTGHFKASAKAASSSDIASVSSSEEATVAPTVVSPPSPTMVSVPAPVPMVAAPTVEGTRTPPEFSGRPSMESFSLPAMPNDASTSTVSPDVQLKDTPTANPLLFQMPMPTLDGNSAATSSFAAGFAAATAHYQQHFYNMMSKMAANNNQLPEGCTANPANMARSA